MQIEETEQQTISQDRNKLLKFNMGIYDLKDVVAPDVITDYKDEQSELAGGFASFLIEQTVNGIANSARWALRQLRR